MEEVSDRAGVADRYFAKALYPDSPSGRKAQWRTIQDIIDALFPEGFDVEIRSCGARSNSPQRELMRTKGGIARREKYKTMPRAERLRIVTKARKTRRQNRLMCAQLQKQQPELLSPL